HLDHRCETFERVIAVAPLEEVDRVDHVVLSGARALLPDHDEPAGILEWERLEQDRIHHAEDRRASSDAERQSQQRHQSKTGLGPQPANRVTKILQHALSPLLLGVQTPNPATWFPANPRQAPRAAQTLFLVRWALSSFDFRIPNRLPILLQLAPIRQLHAPSA